MTSDANDPSITSDEAVQQISEDLNNASLQETTLQTEDSIEEGLDNVDQISDSPDNQTEQDQVPLDIDQQNNDIPQSEPPISISPAEEPEASLYDDPSDEEDGDGEWITPSNVGLHKSRALDLLPSADASRRGKGKHDEVVAAGCMTADFAMQNVLLQMGLSLVGVEGKRIQKVKTWVLRCHACFK